MVPDDNCQEFVSLFLDEATLRLGEMDAGVHAMSHGDTSPRWIEVIQQGAHQIRGNAMMLELRSVGQLASALEYVALTHRDHVDGLPRATVWVLRDACFALRQMLQLVAVGAPADLSHATLLERLAKLGTENAPRPSQPGQSSTPTAAFQVA